MKKKSKIATKLGLLLTSEVVRELQATELEHVAGGGQTGNGQGVNCGRRGTAAC